MIRHSNYFLLRSVSPACAPGQQFVYEVARMTTVLVSCSMEANPDTGLAFRWTFNTTANTISIPVSSEFWPSIIIPASLQTFNKKAKVESYCEKFDKLQILHYFP